MTKKFAAFDIDGTIFRWQLYHELFDELVNQKLVSEERANSVFAARQEWKKRNETFVSYENLLIKAMDNAVVGLDETVIFNAAESIMAKNGHHVYRYPLQLLQRLRSEGYTIIAISGSHKQLVEKFAQLHGIDITFGRQYKIVDGKITGDAVEIYGRKDEILSGLVEQHDLSWEDSYAIGDSAGDISMLKMVKNPIAFNPDEGLLEKAKQEGWKIVVERKSIIYELEKNGNTFVLA